MISYETTVTSQEVINQNKNIGYNCSLCRDNLVAVNIAEILEGTSGDACNGDQNWRSEVSPTGEDPLSNDEDNEEENAENEETEEALPQIEIEVVESYLNCQGNYNTYVSKVLKSIVPISKIEYPNILKRKMRTLSENPLNKKTLILDLDETLVHADFEKIIESHDQTLSFVYNGAEVLAPIILRPGVFDFLLNVSQVFEVIVFTASQREYADAVLNFLDPMNTIFTLRLYREDCIVINNRLCIKDLRIFSNRNLKDMLIVDNSMYSFSKQLSNGILINSFYQEKEDRELYNLYNYLELYILNASDVRKVNEEFFNFNYIMDVYSRNCHTRSDILN